MIAQHESKSQEHYTPSQFVAAARACMGSIDLDPASSDLANTEVGAHTWYGWDAERQLMTDGLASDWAVGENVWLNPPGGSTTKARPELAHITRSHALLWWARLTAEFRKGSFKRAIYEAFSVEQLAHSQRPLWDGMPSILDFVVCIPSKRIAHDRPKDTIEGRPIAGTERIVSKAPSHSSAFVALGIDASHFAEHYRQFGRVIAPFE